MSTINAVNNSLTGSTGSGLFVGNTSPTIETPALVSPTSNTLQLSSTAPFLDSNGNVFLAYTEYASAVNFVRIANADTTGSPSLSANGSDTNIILVLNGKGTSGVSIQGTTAGGNATAGYVGEFLSANGVGVSLTNNIDADVCILPLPGGDWDVYGNVYTAIGGSSTYSSVWCSLTSATRPANGLYSVTNTQGGTANNQGVNAPFLRVNVSTTTNVYLSTRCGFTTSTAAATGYIFARRVR